MFVLVILFVLLTRMRLRRLLVLRLWCRLMHLLRLRLRVRLLLRLRLTHFLRLWTRLLLRLRTWLRDRLRRLLWLRMHHLWLWLRMLLRLRLGVLFRLRLWLLTLFLLWPEWRLTLSRARILARSRMRFLTLLHWAMSQPAWWRCAMGRNNIGRVKLAGQRCCCNGRCTVIHSSMQIWIAVGGLFVLHLHRGRCGMWRVGK